MSACGPTVYRDTWRPATSQDTYPALMDAAINVDADDIQAVLAAHGQFIGHHATAHGYAVRAASVGGTHFFSVQDVAVSSASCRPLPFGGGVTCSGTAGVRPTKIAVIRIEPEHWAELPPHLVPPAEGLTAEALSEASQARYGCEVTEAWGTVKCSNDWRLYSPAHGQTYQQCVDAHQDHWFEAQGACKHLEFTKRSRDP